MLFTVNNALQMTEEQRLARNKWKRENYQLNRDKILKKQHDFYIANKEKVTAKVRAWEDKNPDKKRAYHNKAQKKLRLKDALEFTRLEAIRIAEEIKSRGYYIIPRKKDFKKQEPKWYERG